ncbi:L,D-transpeptidase [Lederbergia lenta]|uniref:ErfK/YbiS/YcfS/YnhG family protein n=1 Tax=Lederbergia lenta TaxID=1467 RepID=A0A2X4VZX4_LEDLE|nr:L,D-transpeptidase [Lederbergia lenta]MEC2325114.1 L,D-transpeptidase [Lederbergia lenta]SQI56391.1 ErfK/YbiS/YcfS/YnhG family protein [Lederbergia lenta]
MRLFLVVILIIGSPFWPLGASILPGDPLIIVNKKTNELAWINDGKIIMETSIATGKTNDLTPEGLFTITVKAENPYYRKKNIPGGDRRNPLGSRWIGFDAKGTDGRIYGLHGTNDPSSIGKYISQGCIRLSTIHLEELYDQVIIGTKIIITNSSKSFEELALEFGARM